MARVRDYDASLVSMLQSLQSLEERKVTLSEKLGEALLALGPDSSEFGSVEALDSELEQVEVEYTNKYGEYQQLRASLLSDVNDSESLDAILSSRWLATRLAAAQNADSGFGSFELLESDIQIDANSKPIGEGAFGIVYKGRCRGKEVAVKELRNTTFTPALIEEFKRECLIMRSLPHTNVLLFMGACFGPDRYLLITELALNGSLQSLLSSSTIKLSFLRKMRMAREIVEGVNWLHCQNPPLLHLDIKPANILVLDQLCCLLQLGEDYVIKLADFGMSRLVAKENESSGYTGGTPLYMAPELFGMPPRPSPACDVYAIGIVLWELLTEATPYHGKFRSYTALTRAILDGERPPVPSNAPPSIAALLKECWQMQPQDRPTAASTLKADPFTRAIAEAIADGEERIVALWSSFAGDKEGSGSAPWLEFQVQFCRLLSVDPARNRNQLAALSALLEIEENQGRVTAANFKRFLSLFKPLRPGGGKEPSTLDEVYAVVKEKWFWGTIDAPDAQKVLKSAKKGHFLVRFSSREGQLAVSYVVKDKSKKVLTIVHGRVDRAESESIATSLKRFLKPRGLKTPLPGRPSKFEVLFVEHPILNSYKQDTGDEDDDTGAWNEESTLIQ